MANAKEVLLCGQRDAKINDQVQTTFLVLGPWVQSFNCCDYLMAR